MKRSELVAYLDQYLRIDQIKDYGPQGLQLESFNEEIKRIGIAVDVSPEIIHKAGAWGADMLLVHHGLFWRSVERIAGPLGERVRSFFQYDMNLYAAHLPLDAHPVVGNNAVLAKMLQLTEVDWWCEAMGTPIGVIGTLPSPISRETLVGQINEGLQTTARLLPHGSETVSRVGIVSGFGADKVAEAKRLGADTLLTGETSHANYWAASDYGMNLIYGGHYATETVGVKALGQHLAEKFQVETAFFDFPTGM